MMERTRKYCKSGVSMCQLSLKKIWYLTGSCLCMRKLIGCVTSPFFVVSHCFLRLVLQFSSIHSQLAQKIQLTAIHLVAFINATQQVGATVVSVGRPQFEPRQSPMARWKADFFSFFVIITFAHVTWAAFELSTVKVGASKTWTYIASKPQDNMLAQLVELQSRYLRAPRSNPRSGRRTVATVCTYYALRACFSAFLCCAGYFIFWTL